jgi:hypothetical protein
VENQKLPIRKRYQKIIDKINRTRNSDSVFVKIKYKNIIPELLLETSVEETTLTLSGVSTSISISTSITSGKYSKINRINRYC